MRLPNIAEPVTERVIRVMWSHKGFLGEEAGDTVVSPLNDVQGNACKPQTRMPWHAGLSLDCASNITKSTTGLLGHTLTGWLSGLSLRFLIAYLAL